MATISSSVSPMPTIRPDFVVSPSALARSPGPRGCGRRTPTAAPPAAGGDGLDVVVQHVGPRREDRAQRALVAAAVRDEHLDLGVRPAGPDGLDGGGERAGAAVGQIVAGDGGDDGEARSMRSTASATRSGSVGSRASGWRVSTRQNPQARVQRSPLIMKVAVPSAQHSKMFGQPASSHTVTRSSGARCGRAGGLLAQVGPDAQPLGLALGDGDAADHAGVTPPALDAHRGPREAGGLDAGPLGGPLGRPSSPAAGAEPSR